MNSILTIFQIIPSIITAIQAIEAAVPGAGAGKQKLDAVITMVTTLETSLSGMIPQLTTVISSLVTLFNSTGIFKSSK